MSQDIVFDQTTDNAWPEEAFKQLQEKGVNLPLSSDLGPHLFPWNDGYYKHCQFYSALVDRRPLLIFLPDQYQQIKEILNFCSDFKLTNYVCAGKHGTGYSETDVLINMVKFKDFRIEGEKVIAGGGLTQGELVNLVTKNSNHAINIGNLHFLSRSIECGTSQSVSVAGLISSGGVSTMRRTFGLTIDSIISLEIVLPPNQNRRSIKVTASEEKNPNLFWALLGGGFSHFGVVTSITMKVHPVDSILVYKMEIPWKRAKEGLYHWQYLSTNAPNSYTEEILLASQNSFGQKEPTFTGDGVFVLPPEMSQEEAKEKVRQHLEPLLKLGATVTMTIQDFRETIYIFSSARRYSLYNLYRAYFLPNLLDKEQIVKVIDYVEKGNFTGNTAIEFEALGGMMASRENDATAFYPRNYKLFTVSTSSWSCSADSNQNTEWVDGYLSLYQNPEIVHYRGFLQTGLKNAGYAHYNKNLKRLRKIKKQYDPFNCMSDEDDLLN